MYSQQEIIEFIKEKSGVDELKPDDDIFQDHGICGDDFSELLGEFQRKYNVDMTGYLWYFHSDEEGNNIGGIFFDPPYKRVTRIPITPGMLTDFANRGRWDIIYPLHKIPKRRWDLIINFTLIIIFVIVVIRACIK
jgi:hypothetical protein